MRVHITATRIDGRHAGHTYGCDVEVPEPDRRAAFNVVDEMGHEVSRRLRQALADHELTERKPDPMHAVVRELFADVWGTAAEDGISHLAREHGGDDPDLLAARIRAIVGGGE